MASAIQFLKGTALRPTVVISGRNRALAYYCLEIVHERIPGWQWVKHLSAEDTSPSELLLSLGTSSVFGEATVINYSNAEQASDWEPIQRYSASPTKNITLIVQANSVRTTEDERWLLSSGNVLNIDCGSLSEESLAEFVMLGQVPEEDASWLVNRYQGDLTEIIRILKCYKMVGDVTSGVVRQICEPGSIPSSPLSRYAVIVTSDVLTLVRQLRRRLRQLVSLSTALRDTRGILQLSRRCDIDPYIVKRLMPLADGSKPEVWLGKLSELIRIAEYVRLGFPGVRQYMEITI